MKEEVTEINVKDIVDFPIIHKCKCQHQNLKKCQS